MTFNPVQACIVHSNCRTVALSNSIILLSSVGDAINDGQSHMWYWTVVLNSGTEQCGQNVARPQATCTLPDSKHKPQPVDTSNACNVPSLQLHVQGTDVAPSYRKARTARIVTINIFITAYIWHSHYIRISMYTTEQRYSSNTIHIVKLNYRNKNVHSH
jgi:hypothetical protein